MQRYGGPAVRDAIVRRLNSAGVRVPQFRLFTIDSEARLNFLSPVTAVGDKVNVRISRAAMNPRDRSVEGSTAFNILRQLQAGEDIIQRQSPNDHSFSINVFQATGAVGIGP